MNLIGAIRHRGRRAKMQQIAEQVTRAVLDGLQLHGERDYLDGTSAAQFSDPAASAIEALRARLRRDAATWADILAADYYQVLATNDERNLRRELVGLSATVQEWILSLDRRIEHRRWPIR